MFAADKGPLRQGDVLLIPVDRIPDDAFVVEFGSRIVLAEGEATGHAHAVLGEGVELVEADDETRYVEVIGPRPAKLVHEEHETISLQPGAYEVRRQREFVPRASDPRLVAELTRGARASRAGTGSSGPPGVDPLLHRVLGVHRRPHLCRDRLVDVYRRRRARRARRVARRADRGRRRAARCRPHQGGGSGLGGQGSESPSRTGRGCHRSGRAALVHHDDFGRLWDAGRDGRGEPIRVLEVVNATPEADGSSRHYFLRVPPSVRTAHEAVAWTFGLGTGEYVPVRES
jgi:hypothetical protein